MVENIIEEYIKRKKSIDLERKYQGWLKIVELYKNGGAEEYKEVLNSDWRFQDLFAKLSEDESAKLLSVILQIYEKRGLDEAKQFVKTVGISKFSNKYAVDVVGKEICINGIEKGREYLSFLTKNRAIENLRIDQIHLILGEAGHLYHKNKEAAEAFLKDLIEIDANERDLDPIVRDMIRQDLITAYDQGVENGNKMFEEMKKKFNLKIKKENNE
ncbi:MAG: hypothetical protein KJ697_02460 [Nanoarchaeota archaeon]|nr:hypothetical protein [Nanoarchaeota archaeon]